MARCLLGHLEYFGTCHYQKGNHGNWNNRITAVFLFCQRRTNSPGEGEANPKQAQSFAPGVGMHKSFPKQKIQLFCSVESLVWFPTRPEWNSVRIRACHRCAISTSVFLLNRPSFIAHMHGDFHHKLPGHQSHKMKKKQWVQTFSAAVISRRWIQLNPLFQSLASTAEDILFTNPIFPALGSHGNFSHINVYATLMRKWNKSTFYESC